MDTYIKYKLSCLDCRAEVSYNNFSKHIDSNYCRSGKLFRIQQIRKTNGVAICRYCNGAFQSTEVANHTRWCEANSNGEKRKVRTKTSRIRICTSCGVVEQMKGPFKINLCPICNKSKGYGNFKFALKDFPEEFDLELLSRYGMFHPTKNPTGVSRDHMLSKHNGFKQRIPSEVIGHPANCQLLLQSENSRKHKSSSIVIEELYVRIREWDSEYN